jgi:hypothetical protein
MGLFLAVAVFLAFATLTLVILNAQIGSNLPFQAQQQTVPNITSPTLQAGGQYILVRYVGYAYTSWGTYTPEPGYMVLILGVQIENHGYDSFPTGSHSGMNWAYYFHLAVNNQQFEPLYLSNLNDQLPLTDVLNGLMTKGYLAFAVPDYLGSYGLIYKSETGRYNVQYLNLGLTSITETQTQTQAIETPGSQPEEQLILESYNWITVSTLTFTVRNVGSTAVTLASVYLGGNSLATGISSAISVGSASTFTLNVGGAAYTTGSAYTLKIVSATGGVFAFSVIDGSSG